VTAEALFGNLPRRREHRKRDREIESRSLLAQLCRREIHGEPPIGPVQLGRGDAATDALLGLLAGPVGQADDCERRQPVLEVRLDLDAPCV